MTAHATLTDVLQPRPCDIQLRCVQPLAADPGSVQEQLIGKAAEKVRSLYYASQRRVAYDEKSPESFFDACYDTYCAAAEVEQVAEDDTTASIALAVFKRAGWFHELLRPTTLAGQVQMQIEALEAARRVKPFLAHQAALC